MTVIAERVTIDPTTEDASQVPLDLAGLDPSWGIYLLEHHYPPPELDTQHGGNADTEGDTVLGSRYKNRMIGARIRISEPSDPAATNLVPNPDFELGTTGWSLSSGSFTAASREREQLPPAMVVPGTDYGIHVKGTKDNTATERFLILETLPGLTGIPIVANTNYVLSAYFWGTHVPVKTGGANNMALECAWYNAAGELLSTSAKSFLITNEQLTRLNVPILAPATAAFAKVRFTGITTTANDALDYWIDRVQLEAGAAVTAYFDGENPGCDWTGARHASASTRPAPDGTRFSRIVRDVTRKLDRIKRQKAGTWRRYSALGGGNPITYDLRAANYPDFPQDVGIGRRYAEISLAAEALPGGRGPEQLIATKEELTAPAIQLLAEAVPGDMPALARLELEDAQGQLQLGAFWGLQQRYYNAAANAELFYEAEGRTALGSAAVEVVTGASGGKTITHKKLVNAWQSVLSTQATGAGAHLGHVGSYRVIARVRHPPINSGEVSLRLVWTQGAFVSTTRNAATTFGVDDRETEFGLVDLGLVKIDKAPAGTTQRWEGRVQAKSTVNSGWIDVDWLMLIPVDEGSGEALASTEPAAPTSLNAFDAYDQSAGAITGKAAALGGVYVVHEGSSATDFQVVEAEHLLTRTTVSDTGELMPGISGRAVGLPVAMATVAMSFDFKTSNLNTFVQAFQFLRYKDKSNFVWVRSGTNESGTQTWVDFNIRVAGASTYATGTAYLGGGNRTAWQTLTTMLVGEQYFVYLGPSGGAQTLLLSGVTSALAALAAGGAYIGDRNGNATATTRWFDNLRVWEPTIDAAVYPNRVLEVRSDQVRRQDSTGAAWGEVPYEGDYLVLPPAGPEKAISRVIAKLSRNPYNADAGIDDVKARLYATPRYIMAPPA